MLLCPHMLLFLATMISIVGPLLLAPKLWLTLAPTLVQHLVDMDKSVGTLVLP